jgi:hypothetical protein
LRGVFSVPELLALAELIIDAIAANGEAADLESIYAYIKEVTTALVNSYVRGAP